MRHKTEFRERLLAWYDKQRRDLPWRRTRDPYAIWVSEIMLQQTRVMAALPYYERFLRQFPTVAALADAPEAELLAHWAGLGYYYRARNLQKAAQAIAAAGEFPKEYDAIRALPGVGEYTAAAVASIAFELPHAVVDGNVFRVLSRLYEDATDIAAASARKHFTVLANELMDAGRPGDFNQAVMELGATICLPKKPQCLLCPVRSFCKAAAAGRQDEFPVKNRTQKQVSLARTVYWVEQDQQILAWRRPAAEKLMPGFWELPEREHLPEAMEGKILGTFKHGITFHNYSFQVVEAELPVGAHACEWLSLARLHEAPVSTILKKAARLVGR